jgi:hypothetical protein
MNRHLHQHGFDPRAGSPPDWLSLILASSSEEEVASSARDYIATWSPEEIAQLPKHCRPWRIRDGEDISTYAFQLTRAHCAGENEDESLLEKMMVFFTHASTRIAQIQSGQL